jgi:sirohydrochlorin cobaltochelatase
MTVDTISTPLTAIQPSADPRAPMASTPMVYNDDQTVAWEQMWDTFCVLASAGGPPHRATRLEAQTASDPTNQGDRAAVAEIMRGIRLVSGLAAQPAQTGWIAVECGQASKARWLSEQILQENVASFCQGSRFFVPVGETFTLKGEIKNVITAVAKTTHYWRDHLAAETKTALAWEARLRAVGQWLRRWFNRA